MSARRIGYDVRNSVDTLEWLGDQLVFGDSTTTNWALSWHW